MDKKEKQKLYYEMNKERIKEREKQYREKNREKILQKKKEYREQNKDKVKEYREQNKDKIKEYIEQNKDKIKEYSKKYYQKNKKILQEKENEYRSNRKKNDSLYKLKYVTRTTICNSFKKNSFKKLNKTELILGCSFDEFKEHLESKFEDWMNWGNYGLYNGELNYGWDIDHITPISKANTEEDVIKLNHYSNLQP